MRVRLAHLVVAVVLALAVALLVVKPVLDTTREAFDSYRDELIEHVDVDQNN